MNATEVIIRRHGDEVILSPRPEDWTAYLTSGPVASKEFMEAVDELRVEEQGERRDDRRESSVHRGSRPVAPTDSRDQ